jgi:hypothetical protein
MRRVYGYFWRGVAFITPAGILVGGRENQEFWSRDFAMKDEGF